MKSTHHGVPLLGFVAPSGTGKTTLLAAVIPLLRAAGLRVGCVKHTHHPFEIDRPGKDSYRLREAGAEQMLIGSATRWALIVEQQAPADAPLRDMLDRLHIASLDLVLVEGFKLESIPKIELCRTGSAHALSCHTSDSVIALATNQIPRPEVPVPVLDLDRPAEVADFIVDYARRTAG